MGNRKITGFSIIDLENEKPEQKTETKQEAKIVESKVETKKEDKTVSPKTKEKKSAKKASITKEDVLEAFKIYKEASPNANIEFADNDTKVIISWEDKPSKKTGSLKGTYNYLLKFTAYKATKTEVKQQEKSTDAKLVGKELWAWYKAHWEEKNPNFKVCEYQYDAKTNEINGLRVQALTWTAVSYKRLKDAQYAYDKEHGLINYNQKIEPTKEEKKEPYTPSAIYQGAINAAAEAEQAVKKELGVPKNATEVAILAEQIQEAKAISQPLVLHYKAKEPVIKVNYFITQKQKDKVRKYAVALGAKPSHIIAQLIDSFIPDYVAKKIEKEGN